MKTEGRKCTMRDAISYDEVLNFEVTDLRESEKSQNLPPFRVVSTLCSNKPIGNWKFCESFGCIDFVNGENFRIWLDAENIKNKKLVEFYVVLKTNEIPKTKIEGEKYIIQTMSNMISTIIKCKSIEDLDNCPKEIFRLNMSLK